MQEQTSVLSDEAMLLRPGDGLPLFMTHCDAGTLSYAVVLAEHIHSSIPVYGLSPLSPETPLLRTIEGMATRMVRMIQKVQPIGPYRLLGWSLGGLLAYEIAIQLVGADQDVDFLGLIGTQNLTTFLRRTTSCHDQHINEYQGDIAANLCTRADSNTQIPNDRDDQETHDTFRRSFLRSVLGYFLPVMVLTCHCFEPDSAKSIEKSELSHEMSRPEVRTNSLPVDRIKFVSVPGTDETLMQVPNIGILGDQISNIINQGGSPPERSLLKQGYSPLIPLRLTSEGKKLLFCIPGAGASVPSFNDLVEGLSPEWMAYGLQPRGLDGNLIPHSTIESCAELYLQSIKSIHPRLPLYLLGHSLGGWITLELTKRLAELGRAVSSITIVDSSSPDEELETAEYDHVEMLLEWIQIAEAHHGRPLHIQLGDLESRTHTEQIEFLHRRLLEIGALPRRTQPDLLYGPLTTFAKGLRMCYTPKNSYKGQANLVLAKYTLHGPEYSDKQRVSLVNRWKAWIPDITPMTLEANHINILRHPSAHAIVRLFRDQEIQK
jgi:arthrofactin-type cyclic lipopeptide synthetase C